MSPKLPVILVVWMFFCLGWNGLWAQQQPAIAVCDENTQTFCMNESYESEICAEIILDPDFTDPIDSFGIIWNDDILDTLFILYDLNNLQHFHTYFFSTSDSCTYAQGITVKLLTYLSNAIIPLNNSFDLTFINPPIAAFIFDQSTICVGEEACFTNISCPDENLAVLSWEYGDGTDGLEDCHTYNTVGTYNITLTVQDTFCMNTATVTMPLQVIEPPIADGIAISGVVDLSADTLVVCADSMGISQVLLDGDSLSLNETIYEWEVIFNDGNYNWIISPNESDPIIQFSGEGIYVLQLTVENACEQPSTDILIFDVVNAQALTLNPQDSTCEMLSYTPNPLIEGAIYVLNGEVIPADEFPQELGVGVYTLEASLSNLCGDQALVDVFEVFAEVDLSILTPISDTLCLDGPSLLLEGNDTIAEWSGPGLEQIGDFTFFNPGTTGTYTLTYERAFCSDTESVSIEVIGLDIQAMDYQKCEWSDPFVLEASESGGVWSSTDCPDCVQGDTFIVSTMVGLGLTTVTVQYNVTSAQACEGGVEIEVTIVSPQSTFSIPDTVCVGVPIEPDITGTVADVIIWRVDGEVAEPPFENLTAGTYNIEQVAVIGECRDSSNQDIVVVAPPAIPTFMATPLEGCADLEVELILDSSVLTEGLNFAWYLDGELFSTLSNPGNITLTQGLSDTTYTIGLAISNGCGSETVEEVITVFPRPIVNFGTNQLEYCSGDTVFFGNASFGSPTSLIWDFGNGETSTDFIPGGVVYFTGDDPTIYLVTLIASNDCGSDTITKEVLINPTDVNAFFSTDPVVACIGEEICFENFSTFGADILFDFGDGITTGDPNPCYTYSDTGFYEVVLYAFGCGFDSTVTTVEIRPLPEVDIEPVSILACPGETINFSANTTGVLSYLWDFDDGSSSTLSNPEHIFYTSGTYQVQLTGFSVDSCGQQDVINVTIVDPPTADFAPVTDSLCSGNGISFINSSSADVISCFYDFGNGDFSSSCQPDYTYNLPGNYTVTLITTNANGCNDTLSQLINVFAEPEPDFEIQLDGSCTPATATFINLSENAESYIWDFGNGDTSTMTNPVWVYDQAIDTPVQLTAINGLCSRIATQSITILPTPSPLVQLSNDAACAPADISFGISSVSGTSTYSWDFDDGTFAFEQNVTHVFQDSGNYEVLLIVSDSVCHDTSTYFVTIYPPVEASVATTDILCFGDATGAIEITVDGGTFPFQYTWSNGVAIEDQTDLPAGDYNLLITDSNECVWSELITIEQPPQLDAMVIDSAIVTCFEGSDGYLCIEPSGGVGDYSLSWDNGATTNCIENVAAGAYTLTLGDANACERDIPFQVYENPEISLVDTALHISCFGFDDGAILIDSILGGIPNVYNTILEGPVNIAGGQSFQDLLPGTYTLTVQDQEGCSNAFNYIIAEPDSVWVNILQDTIMLGLGDSMQIEVNHNASEPIFDWSPFIGLSCLDCQEPFTRPPRTTTYQLLMTDLYGCTDRDTVTVIVELNRDFYIPNTFTPNGDGRNDIFRVRSRLASIERVRVFRVFDRWGELLFERRDFRPQEERPGDAWDGTFRGKYLPPDTFVYFVEVEYVDGETETAEGTVHLIR